MAPDDSRLSRPAAQDHRIAGTHAQRGRVGGDVGPALINDADDAQWRAHALDGEAVRPGPALGDGADRVGQVRHHVHAGRDAFDARVIEREAVQEGRAHAVGLRAGEVFGIGGENDGRGGTDGGGGGVEGARLHARIRQREGAAGRAGAAAESGHIALYVRRGGRRHGTRQGGVCGGTGGGGLGHGSALICQAGFGLIFHIIAQPPRTGRRAQGAPTTMSSRWTISARPGTPRMVSISAVERRMMRSAWSLS